MTQILLRCRDHEASAETIKLECELKARGYIKTNQDPHGSATYLGDEYKFELNSNGVIDFGRDYQDDRFWRTDLHELEIKPGKLIKVQTNYGPYTYEVISVT